MARASSSLASATVVLSKASCESNVTDGSISNEYAFRIWPCAGMVYRAVSKTVARMGLWVRVPPRLLKINIMNNEKVLSVMGKHIKCVEDGMKYSCEVLGEDLFFSTYIHLGNEAIIKRAKAMIVAKIRYENEPVERL